MTHPDKQAALEMANRIGADVTAGLSYEEILSRNPRAVYELAKAVIAQAAELERLKSARMPGGHKAKDFGMALAKDARATLKEPQQ